MKILHIINSLATGGAEKLLLDTIPLYRKKGIEMDILLLWDSEFPFTKALEELGCCKIYILNKSNNYKHIYHPLSIFKIRKIIKNYDVAHVHLFPAQYYTVFANLLNGNRTKLIFTEHNTSNRRINNSIFKGVEQFVYKRYSKLVCITKEIEEIYKKYLGSSRELVVIHNGVAIDKIKQANPLERSFIHSGIKQEDLLLLQVSAFRHQKDQMTLIKSLTLLPDNVKLLLVGIGENLQICQNLTKELDLEQRVYFLGQRMDVPSLLKTADIVVLSSHYEGLSLSSIEGMASRKPFVASDAPGLREIVNGAGVLFPIGNEVKLAEEISKLQQDINYYNNIAELGEKRASEYNIDKMVKSHIKLYKEVYEDN
ncbi:MAG: glycosyltransferase [Myroides sp.]